MTCPSCEELTKNTASCSNCGMDLLLYNKVHMMAVRLYNEGLQQAQGRCFDGAISSLTMCIRLQKDHIKARNLLALVYWETGEVGQAIKHWLKSLEFQEEDNMAQDYLETVQKDPGELAKIGDSITLYNKSLQYLAQGSGDIAIISLRKAIAQNPNYVEAKTVLSLYYIKKNEIDKARELLQEVQDITHDNPKANLYWNYLKPEAEVKREEPRKAVVPKVERIKPLGPGVASTIIQPKPLKGNIVAFVIGAICMLGVYAILITPSKTADLKAQVKVAQDTGELLQEKLEGLIDDKEESIQTLTSEKQALERANEILKQEQMVQEQVLEFQAAESLSKEKDWLGAANKLNAINQEYFSQERKAQFDALIEEVYPKAAEQLYNEGYREYQSKNYDKAIELLEKSYIYAKEERFSDNALYITGRSFEAKENIEQANQYYQSTIDNYPGTDGASSAKRRLK